MPKVTIWIRVDDEAKWKAIENKPEWLHAKLNPESLTYMAMLGHNGNQVGYVAMPRRTTGKLTAVPEVETDKDGYGFTTIDTKGRSVTDALASLPSCKHGAAKGFCKHGECNK